MDDIQHRAKLRRIIEKPAFSAALKKFLTQYPRFKDVWMTMKNDLQDFAHEGTVSSSSVRGYCLKRSARRFETPSFAFYYSYNDDSVTVYNVEVVKS